MAVDFNHISANEMGEDSLHQYEEHKQTGPLGNEHVENIAAWQAVQMAAWDGMVLGYKRVRTGPGLSRLTGYVYQ